MYSNFNFLQNDWQGLAKIGEIDLINNQNSETFKPSEVWKIN